MKFSQPLKRGLCDASELDATNVCCLGEFFLIVVGNAADKMSGRCLRECVKPWSGKYVSDEELREAVEEQGMDGWMLSVSRTERTKVGKIAIGEGFTIHFLNDGSLCLMCFIKELLTKV